MVTFNAEIQNIGVGNASKPFDTGFYIDGSRIGTVSVSGLASGKSVNVSRSWNAVPGSHILSIKADDTNVIIESNESNNIRTANLPSVYQADIVISNITAPSSINDGDTVVFNATVENIGLNNTENWFGVRFYIDGNDIGYAVVNGLSASSSVVLSKTWIATPGDHTLTVTADAAGWYGSPYNGYGPRVNESNETNNSMAIVLPRVEQADLIVSGLTWTPSNFTDGQVVTFNATIENIVIGNTIRGFSTRFLIDDASIGEKYISGLSSGNSTSVTQTWTTTPGEHKIKAVVDIYNQVSESNETNNTIELDLTKVEPADLIVSNLSWIPTSFSDGQIVTFNTTIENIGPGDTTRGFYTRFLIDDANIGDQYLSGLASGASVNVTQTWTATAGEHAVKAVVDVNNYIPESNETNNWLSKNISYVQAQYLLSLSSSESYAEGDTATFSARASRQSSPNVYLGDGDVNLTLTILDGNGSTVFTSPMSYANQIFSGNVDLTGYSKGSYTAKVTLKDTSGLIVEKSVPFKIVDNFSVSISTDKTIYDRGEIVNISGRAQYNNGSPVSNTPVILNIKVKGYTRTYSLVTGTDGNISYYFKPYFSEAGNFTADVNVVSNKLWRSAQASFTMYGLYMQPSGIIDYWMSKNSSENITFILRNYGESDLHATTVNVFDEDTGDGVDSQLVQLPAQTIAPGAEQTFKLMFQRSVKFL